MLHCITHVSTSRTALHTSHRPTLNCTSQCLTMYYTRLNFSHCITHVSTAYTILHTFRPPTLHYTRLHIPRCTPLDVPHYITQYYTRLNAPHYITQYYTRLNVPHYITQYYTRLNVPHCTRRHCIKSSMYRFLPFHCTNLICSNIKRNIFEK